MDPAIIAVVGLLIGLALLVIEFFIPSGGLIFVIACVSLVIGTWGAWKAWHAESFWLFGTYLAVMFILAPTAIVGGLYLLDTTSLGDHILLKAPKPEEVAGISKEVEKLAELIGKRGKTLGLLNPGGMVMVEDTRYHCETPGMMIDPGSEIEVIAVNGPRLVVRVPIEVETSNNSEAEVAATETVQSGDEDTLESFDFDLPESS